MTDIASRINALLHSNGNSEDVNGLNAVVAIKKSFSNNNNNTVSSTPCSTPTPRPSPVEPGVKSSSSSKESIENRYRSLKKQYATLDCSVRSDKILIAGLHDTVKKLKQEKAKQLQDIQLKTTEVARLQAKIAMLEQQNVQLVKRARTDREEAVSHALRKSMSSSSPPLDDNKNKKQRLVSPSDGEDEEEMRFERLNE